MTQVDIAYSHLDGKAKVLRSKKLERKIPSSWSEVSESDRLELLEILSSLPPISAQMRIARYLLDLPEAIWDTMSEVDLQGVYHTLDWVTETSAHMLPQYVYDGKTYYCGAPKMENATAMEFAKADELYGMYVDTGDEEILYDLAGLIYREADTDADAAQKRGDPRMRFEDSAQLRSWGKAMKAHPAYVCISALAYVASCKQYMYDTYGTYIFAIPETDEEDEGGEDPSSTHSSATFGWWGVFMDIAEAGIFGTLDDVHHTNIHTICMYLVKKKIEQQEEERRMAFENSGNYDT